MSWLFHQNWHTAQAVNDAARGVLMHGGRV
jgi:hypothetical protein